MRTIINIIYLVVMPLMILSIDYLLLFEGVGSDFDGLLTAMFVFMHIAIPFIMYHVYGEWIKEKKILKSVKGFKKQNSLVLPGSFD